MDTKRKFWQRSAVQSVGIVGVVILLFFLTLFYTLPKIPKANASMRTATITPQEELKSTPLPTESIKALPTESLEALSTNQVTSEVVSSKPETKFFMQTTMRELGISGISLNGLYASNSFWVPLPANWIVENLAVNLHYTPSPLLRSGRANLNILVNGQEITSINLGGEGEQTVLFEVPVEYIDQGDGLSLSFRGYLRISDILCEETNNPGQWVKILDATEFTIDANPNDNPPRLEDLNTLMAAQEGFDSTLFVLPDDPSSEVLSAAASVAARLGFDDGRGIPRIVTTGSLGDNDLTGSNIVIIGVSANLPLLSELADNLPARLEESHFITLDGKPAPDDHGVVQIMRSPWNEDRILLVVSGGNQSGLRLAENAFANRELFNTLTGPFQFIKEEKQVVDSFTTTPWKLSKATLADFGYEENREVGGVGESGEVYYLRWPPGWIVGEGTQFHLSLIVSPVIQASSHVMILINDEIVGVTSIDSTVAEQSFTFDIPAETVNQTLSGSQLRNMKLEVRVINILDVDECKTGNEIAAWIQIGADSYFTMLHDYSALPNLKTFPFPFVSDQSIAPTIIVLPDEPNEQEIAAGLAVSKYLGDYILDDFNILILTSSQLDPEAHSNAHIIALGTVDRQPWINEFLKTLPPVPEDSVYQTQNGENIGLVLEAVSPWNAERMVLIILSPSIEGLEKGIDLMLGMENLKEASAWMKFDTK